MLRYEGSRCCPRLEVNTGVNFYVSDVIYIPAFLFIPPAFTLPSRPSQSSDPCQSPCMSLSVNMFLKKKTFDDHQRSRLLVTRTTNDASYRTYAFWVSHQAFLPQAYICEPKLTSISSRQGERSQTFLMAWHSIVFSWTNCKMTGTSPIQRGL
jgi:hypothetical protein